MRLRFPKRFYKTLGFRLTAWYAAMFFLSSLVLALVSYLFVFSGLRDNRTAIRKQLAAYQTLAHKQGITAIAPLVARQREPSRRTTYFVRVVDPVNGTVFISHPRLWEKFNIADLPAAPFDGQWQYYAAQRDGDLLEVANGRLTSGALLQVGRNIADRKEVLERFRDTLLATIIPMMLIGLAGGGYLAYRALRPIRSLTAVTRSIVDTGSFDARVPESRAGDELNELVVLFNRMLAKIDVLIAGMREALDNVAHDFRTPLARIRGESEVALHNKTGVEQLRDILASNIEESDRLLALLNSLMDISEAESCSMRLHLEEVKLRQVIDEVVDLYQYSAEDVQVNICVDVASDIAVTADRARLRQVLANLLDNAVKYSVPGGKIIIHVARNDEHVVVTFKDDGIGIAPEDISKVWDRLYRGDRSRSQPGLGLGLSLVRAVVYAHQGSVDVTSTPGEGSIFSISLPRSLAGA